MKKWLKISMLALLLFGLTGCGFANHTEEELTTNLQIEKDGKIIHTIYENFTETYYNIDDLVNMIQESITEYENEHAGAEITLKSCAFLENQADMIKVVMEYNDCYTYSGFNEETLFTGTIQEAYEAGYDLNLQLTKVNGKETEVIGKDELLNMGSQHIVLYGDDEMMIQCYGPVEYMNQQAELINNKTVIMKQTQDPCAIVFK